VYTHTHAHTHTHTVICHSVALDVMDPQRDLSNSVSNNRSIRTDIITLVKKKREREREREGGDLLLLNYPCAAGIA